MNDISKKDITQLLSHKVSSTAIKLIDGEARLVGKYCAAVPLDASGSQWDLWLHNPQDAAAGLGTRKLTNILMALGVTSSHLLRDGSELNRLDGEAYGRVTTGVILDNLKTLGVRRKRVMSEESRAANVARLSKYHQNTPSDARSAP